MYQYGPDEGDQRNLSWAKEEGRRAEKEGGTRTQCLQTGRDKSLDHTRGVQKKRGFERGENKKKKKQVHSQKEASFTKEMKGAGLMRSHFLSQSRFIF